MKKTRVLSNTLSLIETRLVFLFSVFLCFAAPFILGRFQLINGTLINAVLFSFAVLLPDRLFPAIIIFPSLGVLSRGLIFGPLTPFLVYFIPFIWLANLSLILVFKKNFPFLGYFFSVILASLVKLSILFFFANIFFKLKIIPRSFLMAMGINQLITACLGGFLAFLFLRRISNVKIRF